METNNKADDMSEYVEAYSSEAEEHLQNLNDNFLELEKNPNDDEIINQLFRSSHTLKSSSAAMGFMKISELAHSMEDVLGRIRKKEIMAKGEVIDVLLKSFDSLEKMIGNVTNKKEEGVDTSSLIKELKKQIEKPVDVGLELKNSEKTGSLEQHIEGEEGGKLAEAPDSLKTLNFVKVGVKRLDKMMNLVGELLISKMRLEQVRDIEAIKALESPLNELERLIADIQHEVMQSRLVPVGQIFMRFPRMIRDISEKENKKVNFIMKGEEIELDRSLIDKLGEPLIHLLRNAVDHGIETPEERKKNGKEEIGEIVLEAKKEKNSVIISVSDDGNGFDLDRIREVALEKGVVNEKQLSAMSDKKIMMLPFHPNFSTSKKVTEVSGRGVGLDVVKTKTEEMNGVVNISSEKNKGTTITLELPLTLAIIPCFLIQVGRDVFGIPLSNIVRTVKIYEKDVKTIENHETFILDEESIPLIRTHELVNINNEKKDSCVIVIVEKAGEKAGLTVDKIIGQQELIIKPLEQTIRKTKGFSGATILGDGSVALIFDINSLI